MNRATPTSPTKIRKIADSILKSITTGELRNGDRVASERQLAKQFDVSLGTAQRALQELEHRGILSREHGRGSFVRGLGASVDARYVRFVAADGGELPLFWHILKHQSVKGTRQLISYFGPTTPLVRIDRQVDVNGKFSLYSQFFLPERFFKTLSSEVTDGTNLRELISRRLALPAIRVEKLIGFGNMPPAVARSVGHAPSQPGLIVEWRGYTADDQPVYLQRLYGKPFVGAMMALDPRD